MRPEVQTSLDSGFRLDAICVRYLNTCSLTLVPVMGPREGDECCLKLLRDDLAMMSADRGRLIEGRALTSIMPSLSWRDTAHRAYGHMPCVNLTDLPTPRWEGL
eukprot:COSAG02_NODE_18898_length_911_cov_1.507389_1_plen_104_part_00